MRNRNQPINTEQLGEMSQEALRLFLGQTITETLSGNSEQEAMVERMMSDAEVFAVTMRDAGARVDSAAFYKPNPHTSLSERVGDVGLWIVRRTTNYGGALLYANQERNRLGSSVSDRHIAVLNNGSLVTAISHRRSSQSTATEKYVYHDGRIQRAGTFIARTVFDDENGPSRIYQEWLNDLAAAAERYNRS